MKLGDYVQLSVPSSDDRQSGWYKDTIGLVTALGNEARAETLVQVSRHSSTGEFKRWFHKDQLTAVTVVGKIKETLDFFNVKSDTTTEKLAELIANDMRLFLNC